MRPYLLLLLVAASVFSCNPVEPSHSVTQFVDPFIGTGGHGHTYPGAVLPFGMVQLSPDNGTQGWDWCGGYHYSDSVIVGFSHTHLSGTGIGDLVDISMMPSVGRALDTLPTRSLFTHSQEAASPGYYRVKLLDYNIQSELTVSEFAGWQRHTFPAADTAMLRIDLGFAINWDRPTDTYFTRIDDSTYGGYRYSTGWAKDQRVYFAMRLNKPISRYQLLADKEQITDGSARGTRVVAGLSFATSEGEQVVVKTGISFASLEGALAGLNGTVGWDFDAVKAAAEAEWNAELSKVIIDAPDTIKTIFYTSLYHAFLAPSRFSDATGHYKGADGKVHHSPTPIYTIQSLWDTFRGANPLFTLLQTDRVGHIINSFLRFYEQHGLLPVWDLHFNETNTMTGYHAVPVIADAILKDIGGFDYEQAFEAMKASAMQDIRATNHYRKYGYVPQDKHGWSVTMTLEYAFDDWCIAQVAQKLGKQDDYEEFSRRALSYRNLYDPATRFFRAKNSDGRWVHPFDPMESEHGFDGKYIEGTAWQHTFFVPHAVEDFAALLGGKDELVSKLDSLFTNNQPMTGKEISSDISGLIGQYAHGNEPSHHIAYMYALLGQPAKGARRIREIMTTLYNTTPDGLSGNEDCGQMSAWYVWSALGMYPMNPASGQYIFGSPIIDKAVVKLPSGNTLTIRVINQGPDKPLIRKITRNGKEFASTSITHAELLEGGTLTFEMGE